VADRTLVEFPDLFLAGYLLSRFLGWQQEPGGVISSSPPFGFVWGVKAETGNGGGVRGENGKPIAEDALGYLGESAIFGKGGSESAGGWGFFNGSFGYGGSVYTVQPSCGGGGGWFGGGSSFMGAGGGGGSGYVLTADSYRPEGYEPPSEFEALSWALMPGVNFRNGFCLITDLATSNFWVFDYTGEVQKFVVPEDGVYRIDCFGAEGGGSYPNFEDIKSQYSGGMGGYAGGEFYFEKDTELFIYVGQFGNLNQMIDAWNGGGHGSGGCYGGGGATDVRWSGVEGAVLWNQNLYDRFIVAGGGGGQHRDVSIPLPPTSGTTPPRPPGPPGDDDSGDYGYGSYKVRYLLGYNSLIHVDFVYQAGLSPFDGEVLTLHLYADDELVATKYVPLKNDLNSERVTFEASDFILPGSSPRLYDLRVQFIPPDDTPFIIVPNTIKITIEQRFGPNDIIPPGSEEEQGQIAYNFYLSLKERLTFRDKVRIIFDDEGGDITKTYDDLFVLTDSTTHKFFDLVILSLKDKLRFDDKAKVSLLTHFKVTDGDKLEFQDSGIIYFEGDDPPDPYFDKSFLEQLGLSDKVVLDLRELGTRGFFELFNISDKAVYEAFPFLQFYVEDNLAFKDKFTFILEG